MPDKMSVGYIDSATNKAKLTTIQMAAAQMARRFQRRSLCRPSTSRAMLSMCSSRSVFMAICWRSAVVAGGLLLFVSTYICVCPWHWRFLGVMDNCQSPLLRFCAMSEANSSNTTMRISALRHSRCCSKCCMNLLGEANWAMAMRLLTCLRPRSMRELTLALGSII